MWEELSRFTLSGENNSTASINQSHRVRLGYFLQRGNIAQAMITLVGVGEGGLFRINGLARCQKNN